MLKSNGNSLRTQDLSTFESFKSGVTMALTRTVCSLGLKILITQDPVSKRAGMIGRYAHGSLWPVIGMTLTQIEDVDERRAFTERALTALCSGTEPLGVRKDVSLYRFLLMDVDIRS